MICQNLLNIKKISIFITTYNSFSADGTMTIYGISHSDSGNYKCEAQDSNGSYAYDIKQISVQGILTINLSSYQINCAHR